ncbi:MAG: acyl carrier protein [Agathobacter sp.]|nr:acyl carrier protein [Agathobacter sp.]
MTETKQVVIETLREICKGKDIQENTSIYEGLGIDSISIFNELLPRLEGTFGIQISPLDLMPENFETVTTLADLVDRIKERNNG